MKNSDKKNEEKKEEFSKGEPNVQDKPDDKRVPTVTPANENGKPGPAEGKNSKL